MVQRCNTICEFSLSIWLNRIDCDRICVDRLSKMATSSTGLFLFEWDYQWIKKVSYILCCTYSLSGLTRHSFYLYKCISYWTNSKIWFVILEVFRSNIKSLFHYTYFRIILSSHEHNAFSASLFPVKVIYIGNQEHFLSSSVSCYELCNNCR